MALQFRPLIAALLGLGALLTLLGPPAAAWWWRRRSGAPWSAWGYGVLVFVLSQVVLRLPWQIPLGIWLGPRLAKNAALTWTWMGVSALTAGLFEECGRWAGYRWLVRRERSFRVGVMFGLGHGGVESILLAGLGLATTLVVYALVATGALPLPDEVQAKTVEALSKLGPGDAVAGALERVMAMTVHVALSLVVLQGFAGGAGRQGRWLLAAIAAHFACDFTSVAGAAVLHRHGALVVEAAVLPSALAAAAVIAWARRRTARVAAA